MYFKAEGEFFQRSFAIEKVATDYLTSIVAGLFSCIFFPFPVSPGDNFQHSVTVKNNENQLIQKEFDWANKIQAFIFKCLATQTRVRPSHTVTLSGTRRKHATDSFRQRNTSPCTWIFKRTQIHFWRDHLQPHVPGVRYLQQQSKPTRLRRKPTWLWQQISLPKQSHGFNEQSRNSSSWKYECTFKGCILPRYKYIFSEEASHFPLREIRSEKELLQCLSLKSRRKKHIKGSAAEFGLSANGPAPSNRMCINVEHVKCNINFCFYVLSSGILENLAHFDNSQRCTSFVTQ